MFNYEVSIIEQRKEKKKKKKLQLAHISSNFEFFDFLSYHIFSRSSVVSIRFCTSSLLGHIF